MKERRQNDSKPPRIPYFFCTKCNARRDAVDPGEVFPVCIVCHKNLQTLWEDVSPIVQEQEAPRDERPPEAAPIVQERWPVRRKQEAQEREDARLMLRELVSENFRVALQNPDTFRFLLTSFNPFVRGIVNHMVIDGVNWQAAVGMLDREFCLRYAKQLEDFKRWAQDLYASDAVPAFMEPEHLTRNEPPLQSDISKTMPSPAPS